MSTEERYWHVPELETTAPDRGAANNLIALWPGIEAGRPAPIFAYPVPVQEYLRYEDATAHRHEYVDGYVYSMAGASDAHVRIQQNLIAALLPQLRGTGCRGYHSDMRLRVERKREGANYYYPDYFVTCSELDTGPDADVVKSAPCLVVEITSKSTASVDRSEKLDNYQSIAAVQQYWLIDQNRRRVIVYTRDDTRWIETQFNEATQRIECPVAGVGLTVEDIYADVVHSDP